jgi:hypothetical protein
MAFTWVADAEMLLHHPLLSYKLVQK